MSRDNALLADILESARERLPDDASVRAPSRFELDDTRQGLKTEAMRTYRTRSRYSSPGPFVA